MDGLWSEYYSFSKVQYTDIDEKRIIEKDSNNRTILHYLAFHGRHDIIKTLIEKSKLSTQMINQKDTKWNTPIHLAARNGLVAIMELFKSFEPDWTIQNKQGRTALHLAVKHRHEQVINWFKENIKEKDLQALLNIHDRKALTPTSLALASSSVLSTDPSSPYAISILKNFPELVYTAKNVTFKAYQLPDSNSKKELSAKKKTENEMKFKIMNTLHSANILLRSWLPAVDLVDTAKYSLPFDKKVIYTLQCLYRDDTFHVFALIPNSEDQPITIICQDSESYYNVASTVERHLDEGDAKLIIAICELQTLLPEDSKGKAKTRDIHVLGFGIGGLDAQYAAAAIVNLKLSFDKLILVTFRAPGIDSKLARKFQTQAAANTIEIYHNIIKGDHFHLRGGAHLELENNTFILEQRSTRYDDIESTINSNPHTFSTRQKYQIKAIIRAIHFEPLSDKLTQRNRFPSKHSLKDEIEILRSYFESEVTSKTEEIQPARPRSPVFDEEDWNQHKVEWKKYKRNEKSADIDGDVTYLQKKVNEYGKNKTEVLAKILKHRQNYASGEFAFHFLNYRHMRDGEKITMHDFDGKRELKFKMHRLVHQKGLYAYILIPDEEQTKKAIVCFQGTLPNDINTIRLDMEKAGAGHESLKRMRLSLLIHVTKIICDHKIEHILVGGHSLGGALAQNFFVSLLHALAFEYIMTNNLVLSKLPLDKYEVKCLSECLAETLPKKSYSGLMDTLKKLSCYTYNSAGVPKSTADLSHVLAKILVEAKILNTDAICIYNQRVFYDPVGHVGEAHILSHAPKEIAHVELLRFDEIEHYYQSHTKFQWTQKQVALYSFFNNKKTPEKIRRNLGFKLEPSDEVFRAIKDQASACMYGIQ